MSIGAVSGGAPDYSSLRAFFEEQRAAKFETADADRSGGLTLEEFEKLRADSPFASANVAGAPSTEEVFSGLDADGDGEVTQSEFANAKPPGLAGGFSPETFSGLLSAQEQSGSPSILDFLNFSSEETDEEESEETNLVDAFLDILDGSEES